MIKCSKCNSLNPTTAFYCYLCHEPFSKSFKPPQCEDYLKETNSNKNNKFFARIIILSSVIVILISGLGIKKYLQPKKTIIVGIKECDIKSDPVQIDIKNNKFFLEKGGYTFEITSFASYTICGKIVGMREYGSDWTSLVSPMDIAIVWGKLAEQNALNGIKFSQSSRWYFFKYDEGYPYNEKYILDHSSNNHIIPASSNIERAIKTLNKNTFVALEGELVRIKAKRRDEDFWWNSSSSRDDRGDGSCELIYLKRVTIGSAIYE